MIGRSAGNSPSWSAFTNTILIGKSLLSARLIPNVRIFTLPVLYQNQPSKKRCPVNNPQQHNNPPAIQTFLKDLVLAVEQDLVAKATSTPPATTNKLPFRELAPVDPALLEAVRR